MPGYGIMPAKTRTTDGLLLGIYGVIARRYDLVNFIISWGQDSRWRRETARLCQASRPRKVLEVGCGSGDLTRELARYNAEAEITGVDFSQAMLNRAGSKLSTASSNARVKLVRANAAALPFAVGTFDAVVSGFALRNMTYHNDQAGLHLGEMARVLRKGGRLVVVETSQPGNSFIRAMYHLYLRLFAFPAGWLISGSRSAFAYLAESSREYYTAPQLATLLKQSGFSEVTYRRFLWGAMAIHVATK
jgi:demethylmenaquinone methyltransferase / 2-methoxy-6-polyprenyl-1,4-benzoquinol methylase